MKRDYKKYLLSDEWASIRADIITSRGGKCERCGNTKKLQVHHKTYKNIFKEEPSDLELLCSGCHMEEHGIKDSKSKTVIKKKPKLDKKLIKKELNKAVSQYRKKMRFVNKDKVRRFKNKKKQFIILKHKKSK